MQKRPSGATIQVLKTFASADECAAQMRFLCAATPAVALVPERMSDASFTMPLAVARVPTSAFPALLEIYRDLWGQKNVRPYCFRDEYHAYVMGRTIDSSAQENGSWTLPSTLADMQAVLDKFYCAEIRPLPIAQDAYVHGDATVSNAVFTRGGPRLIDFSVRASPSEFEVDLSKLVFSALGFDLGPERQGALSEAIRRFTAGVVPSRELMTYYLLSHCIRVFSREPPRYTAQHLFFNSVFEHVQAQM